jgi:hypothetical protein
MVSSTTHPIGWKVRHFYAEYLALLVDTKRLMVLAVLVIRPMPLSVKIYSALKEFLSHFGFDTLRDLPDMEQFEEAGLLSKQRLLAGELLRDDSESLHLVNIEEEGEEDLEPDEPPLALSSEDL